MYETLQFSKDSSGQSMTPQEQGTGALHCRVLAQREAPCPAARMGESMVYTDLQLSKAHHTLTSPCVCSPPDLSQEDCTYESFQLSQVGRGPARHWVLQHREPRWCIQPLPLGLLAACLALLATTIALGVCYWQQGQLMGQVRSALEQAQVELVHMQEQAQDLQQQLNISKTALDDVKNLRITDCCLETWVLYRGRCLFLSNEEKTWWQSKEACEWKSSRLLILWDQDHDLEHMKLPSFLTTMNASYWIGLWKASSNKGWTWIDGTPYPEHWKLKGPGSHGAIKGVRIETGGWQGDKRRWVCEKSTSCPWEAPKSMSRM
ncbi:hypothetical protein Y1Q_0010544 [Alligator mississippiensis]|uniref:C-type lectin domain-containing protein n=1 Tax=Alligator mississippiensis TaxID=8496 RepID=A0A151LZ97_ALLMI|nr:hypothetical protein Y1Q_0010544 [Alligator mississippiensis]